MFKIIKKLDKNILFFLLVAVIILWQMLKPGYILTLDMIFTPKLNLKPFLNSSNFFNNLPLMYFLKFLNFFLPGWIIQKILLITLFFLMGWLAFIYLPIPKKYYANYFAALFYTINPFVYERFLAGHWMVLFGYAFLPPFFYYLLKLKKEPVFKNVLGLFCWLFLINLFSIHIFLMSLIIFTIYFFINLIILNKDYLYPFLRSIVIGGICFLFLSSYWIIPCLKNKRSLTINILNEEHWEAFKTSGDKKLGTLFNVLSLNGFWGEKENWAGYFIWAKDYYIFWIITLLALFVLIFFGLMYGLKFKKDILGILLIIFIFSLIFSSGLGDTFFKNFNLWLFKNIKFWRGFRDSQKWSSYLAFTYAILGGWGVVYLGELLEKKNRKFSTYGIFSLMFLSILNTYSELGGFSRQLKPVWYPDSWYEVNEILKRDQEDFKVLFLPWHEYLSFNFNYKLVISNPAEQFFEKDVIQSQNMEMKGVNVVNTDLGYDEIDRMIVNDTSYNNLEILRKNKIKYIILTSDLANVDKYQYKFISQKGIFPLIEAKEMGLFQLKIK